LIDFRTVVSDPLQAILDWPLTQLDDLRAWIEVLDSGTDLSPGAKRELEVHRLIDRDGHLTKSGLTLAWSFKSELWQQGDENQEFLRSSGLDSHSNVLDVGCNTGKAIRDVAASCGAWCAGVDLNGIALALGSLLAARERSRVHFFCTTAHSLPFLDGTFSHVICRNALTYMHQRRVLREMVRVLRPGGLLFLRFENVRHDMNVLLKLVRRRSVYQLSCRLRDFVFGLVHHLFGWQLEPGSGSILFRTGRCFASTYRVGAILRGLNCKVIQVSQSRCCPQFLGAPTQNSILIRKPR
jgi:SAM-dependent methyltransferase